MIYDEVATINLNSQARFTPTERGLAIMKGAQMYASGPDEQGRYIVQLYVYMHVFGPALGAPTLDPPTATDLTIIQRYLQYDTGEPVLDAHGGKIPI